ncbi:hypothetical protein PG993_011806 [Apiospora rasikravindrae]|uniref:Uncharacterized protein n=1 Tax=Apiospora rasikravindrae TaxID=990691 RepID=A0ABR1S0R1_9PEZI
MRVGVLHAIFFHYIGVKWSIFFKEALSSFISFPGPWLKSQPDFSTHCGSEIYVPYVRDEFHRKHCFVSRLIDLGKPGDQEKRDLINGRTDAEQKIFQVLSTEIAVNVRLHEDFTVLQSSFCRWDRLPHKTVYQILSFFGVSEKWLEFFLIFLEAPLKFPTSPGSSDARTRLQGTSPSPVLSDVLGEVIFFCLDMAVNQATRGGLLHRSFNNLWFWSHSQDQVVTAWATIQRFATVTGTQIRKQESGCVRLSHPHNPALPLHQSLPRGDIKWGLWRLSPTKARFEIDQIVVDRYVTKLRYVLESKQTGIISLIQTWNSHVENLTSMFALPANCMGRDHLEMFIETHSRIQRMLFKEGRGDDGDGIFEGFDRFDDHLKALLEQRYDITDVPNAYLLFPIELGGLQLNSPITWLCKLQGFAKHRPSSLLDEFRDFELETSRRFEAHMWGGEEDRQWPCPFDGTLVDVYGKLLEFPLDMGSLYDKSDLNTSLLWPSNPHCQWDSGTYDYDDAAGAYYYDNVGHVGYYWRWILKEHGEEAMEKFGGLELVDMKLLPRGTLDLMEERRAEEGY